MIFVINKKNAPTIKENSLVVNIMRPSILSNEWSHNPNTAAKHFVSTRKEAIEEYKKSFLVRVKNDKEFRKEIIRLFHIAKTKHIYLLCCCKPQSCHGDVIKWFLEYYLKNDIFSEL